MIKILKFSLLTLLATVVASNVSAQMTTYATAIYDYNTQNTPFRPSINSITIAFYPEMAVSYHEDTSSTGFVSVLNSATPNANAHKLQAGYYIKDMVQHAFSDTVYFCGTWQNTVGVLGFFVVQSNGSISGINYMQIPTLRSVNKLVSYNTHSGNHTLVAIGEYPSQSSYCVVTVELSSGYPLPFTLYDIQHPSEPVDLVCTDDFVALLSVDQSRQSLFLRKLDKHYLPSSVANSVFEFPLSETIFYTPSITFMGCKVAENGENDVAIAYMSEIWPQWTSFIKTIDLATMTMTNAQKHLNAQKNEITGLTYLTGNKQIVLLEVFEPGYAHMGSSAVFIDPNIFTSYTTDVCYALDYKYFSTIDRQYSSGMSADHFLAGISGTPRKTWWAQKQSFTTTECILKTELYVSRDLTVNCTEYDDPLTESYCGYNMYQYALSDEMLDGDIECPKPSR